MLASSGNDFYSALGSQPVALVACESNVTGEVSTPPLAHENQIAMKHQTTPWEVRDHVVIPPNELRRSRVFQRGYGTGTVLRKTNVNAVIQLQHGTRTFTRKFRQTKLMKLDTELSPRDPHPTLGLSGP